MNYKYLMKVFNILLNGLLVLTSMDASIDVFDSDKLGTVLGNLNHEWGLFENFRNKFPRKHNSLEEIEHRFKTFKNNLKIIVEHNDGNHNFTMGINRFTDITNEEYKDFVSKSGYSSKNNWKLKCNDYDENGVWTDNEIDWRDYGVVNTPRDQGNAGTCWAFSATTSVESAYAIETGILYDLSEQQLVDCDRRSSGTSGGGMSAADVYLIGNGGQCLETSYPYTASDTKCHDCEKIVPVYNCFEVEEGNELAMKEILNQQPISVAIDASSKEFQHYSSGVIDSSSCYTELNHGVAVVGYGEKNNQKYWIVKNSWGINYGMDGYVLIGRTDKTDNKESSCGIAMSVSFPQVTNY